jgi:hypothetical protein
MKRGDTKRKYEFCFVYKERVDGVEFVGCRCHRKGGNMEKQRRNGSSLGTGLHYVRQNANSISLIRFRVTNVAVAKQCVSNIHNFCLYPKFYYAA